MVNKPAGVVSTAREPGGARPWSSWSTPPPASTRLGRLDADSTGLILLTNDGELANLLTHPRYGVEDLPGRLRRPPRAAPARRLRRGVELDDGPTAPAGVRRCRPACSR